MASAATDRLDEPNKGKSNPKSQQAIENHRQSMLASMARKRAARGLTCNG